VKRSAHWLLSLGILAAVLAVGPDLWAAPAQDLGRQTVPTRTPEPPPPTDTPPPPPPTETPPPPGPTAPAASPGASEEVPVEEGAESLLPEAGGQDVRLYLALATIGVGLFALATVGRRAVGGR